MLVVLEPLAFIFLTVSKCICTKTLTLAFYVFAFILVSVGKFCLALTVGFTAFQFTVISGLVFKSIIANYYFCALISAADVINNNPTNSFLYMCFIIFKISIYHTKVAITVNPNKLIKFYYVFEQGISIYVIVSLSNL